MSLTERFNVFQLIIFGRLNCFGSLSLLLSTSSSAAVGGRFQLDTVRCVSYSQQQTKLMIS